MAFLPLVQLHLMLACFLNKTRKFIKEDKRRSSPCDWERKGRGECVWSYKKQLGLKLWSPSFSFLHGKVQNRHQGADRRLVCKGATDTSSPCVSFICHLCLLPFVYITNLTWHNKGTATRSKKTLFKYFIQCLGKEGEEEEAETCTKAYVLFISIRARKDKEFRQKWASLYIDYAWIHNKTPKDMWNASAFANGNWFWILFIFN